ncbi:MAG TPA: ATP-binding protein [Bryobacteraceae bacterium]|nr:ATP-binding protein [Bryobacteraceae bacterium]
MKSMFAKTLGWFLVTMTVAIGGILLTTALTLQNSGSPQSPFVMLLRLQVEDAKKAYETGGKPALAAALTRFQNVNNAKMVFTDAKGVDLLTGQAHPELMAHIERRPQSPLPFLFIFRRAIIPRHDATRQYWLFLIDERRSFLFWFLQPQHLWIIGAVILLCYGFSYHLTSPLRRLREVVDQFGRGELSVRAAATGRHDEFGQLSASFNKMADRIQTLLTAERRLLMDISHELRSPLARLGVAVELARSGEERDHMLDRIEKEAQRLNQLVGELLQVTRVEGDPSQRKTETVELDRLLGEVVEDSLIEANMKGCRIELTTAGPASVTGDEELLRRAIENVLRNAIRYAPTGSAIGVELTRSGSLAQVLIRDQGPGVPEESLARIFDAFYRVDSDRNRVSGGVGLGLAIARRSVELHGGTLRAENKYPGLAVMMGLPLSPIQPQLVKVAPLPDQKEIGV